MFDRMGLTAKIYFLVNGVVIVSFLAVIYIVSSKSIQTAKDAMYKTTEVMAEKYCNEIKAELQGARTTAETMSRVMEALKDGGYTNRNMMNNILRHTLESKQYITAFCVVLEPNTWDGKDKDYANVKPQYDKTGRYVPYFNKLTGDVQVEPLVGYETADWYVTPFAAKTEFLTDPYPYKIRGKDVMLESFIFPIFYKGESIGVVATDIVLDKLQELVSKVRPYGTGYTAIIGNSGDIVAHPDTSLLGKKMEDKKAMGAVQKGERYISSDDNYYTVYLPIRFSEVTKPWSVAVSVPMNKVLEDAKSIRNYVIVVASIALLIIGFVLYLISRSIARPIQILSRTANALGEGKFDTPIDVVETKDEIGALSKAFKFMAAKINELIKQMQKYAAELEEKNKYLNKLHRLKDEFLANTSHELRTPLNGIIGIVESMLEGAVGPVTDNQKYNLTLVSRSGKRLLNLINDILDFSKLKNGEINLQLRPVDLRTTVDVVLAISKELVKNKDVKLVNDVAANIPPLEADENRLQQILYNLVGNAIKFTEKGSVRVAAKTAGDLVKVSVTDTGIGIPKEKFANIFESFEQADGSISREYGGTGLGLSISKKLIELHGGTIRLESELKKGSAFTFSMPAHDGKGLAAEVVRKSSPMIGMENLEDERPQETQESVVVAGGNGNTKYNVLIVDDEPINLQVLTNVLSSKEYQLTKAYNGMEALEKLNDPEQKFDLILLDLMMPKMSGYEVCERVRKLYSLFEVPVLMLTAKNQTEDIVLGFQSGANDYVQKPFVREELLARIKTQLSLRQAVSDALSGASKLADEKQRRLFAEALQGVTNALTSTLDLKGVLIKILATLSQFCKFVQSAVLLPENGIYTIKITSGYKKESDPIEKKVDISQEPFLQQIISTRQVVRNTDNLASSFVERGDDKLQSIGIPINSRNELVGIIVLNVLKYMDVPTDLLLALSGQAGIGINNAELYEKIHKLAFKDVLTDCGNRRYFFEVCEREQKLFEKQKNDLSMMLIGIDQLNDVNNAYGHAVGDKAIVHVAQTIQKVLREHDIIGRYGGGEFSVLLPETGKEAARAEAEKIRKAVESASFVGEGGARIALTVSVGVCAFKQEEKLGKTFERVNEALKTAKQKGQNKIADA